MSFDAYDIAAIIAGVTLGPAGVAAVYGVEAAVEFGQDVADGDGSIAWDQHLGNAAGVVAGVAPGGAAAVSLGMAASAAGTAAGQVVGGAVDGLLLPDGSTLHPDGTVVARHETTRAVDGVTVSQAALDRWRANSIRDDDDAEVSDETLARWALGGNESAQRELLIRRLTQAADQVGLTLEQFCSLLLQMRG